MTNEINITVTCPNCGNTFQRKKLDELVFVETCTDEICGMKYLVAIETKSMTAVTELLAEDRGYHRQPNSGDTWIAFNDSSIKAFKTEKEAIEWLGYSMLADKKTADVRAKERTARMYLQIGQAAAWVVMVAYTLFLLFSAAQAHADNAQDLKAFIDNGKYPPAPPPPILKAGKPSYEQVRDAVASGVVQAGYVAIRAYSQSSNKDAHRIIFALERDGVIRWDSEGQKWELVK